MKQSAAGRSRGLRLYSLLLYTRDASLQRLYTLLGGWSGWLDSILWTPGLV